MGCTRNSLFRKKSIDQLIAATRGEKALKRELIAFDLTMLGIGAIIGWDLILEYMLAASAVSAGWSGYFVSFLNGLGIRESKRIVAPETDRYTIKSKRQPCV